MIYYDKDTGERYEIEPYMIFNYDGRDMVQYQKDGQTVTELWGDFLKRMTIKQG